MADLSKVDQEYVAALEREKATYEQKSAGLGKKGDKDGAEYYAGRAKDVAAEITRAKKSGHTDPKAAAAAAEAEEEEAVA